MVAEVEESSRARICCSVSVGVRGEMVSGRMRLGVAVADDLEVEVVGVLATGEHGVQLLSGLLPGQQAVHGVGGDALRTVNSGGVAETGRGAHIVDWQPTVRWLRLCRTVRSPRRPKPVMVHRSPFLTQSVAVRRSRRSLARVMITSPTPA